MRRWLAAVAVAGAMALPAQAQEEEQDVPRSGAHPAVPEYSVTFGRRFEVRAQLVVDRNGALPVDLTKPVQLRFDLSLRAVEGAQPEDLALTCRMVIVGTDGRQTPLRDGPCFEGPLPRAGLWVPMSTPVRFRPNPHGAAGAGGVLVEISAGRGRPKRVMATYGWAPEGSG